MTDALAQLLTGTMRALGWVLHHTPFWVKWGMAQLLASCWWYLVPVRRAVALENLQKSDLELPSSDRKALLHRMLYHLALNAMAFLELPFIPPEEALSRFHWEGLEHLKQAAREGQGGLILSAHLGAFDQLACACAQDGLPLTIISRTARSNAANALWMGHRRAAGLEILSERHSLRGILRALKAGRLVVMVLDQNMHRNRGIFVGFMGRLACTVDSLAILALRKGVPILPVFTWRGRGAAHHAVCLPPLAARRRGTLKEDVHYWTQLLSDLTQEQIKQHPEQWLWLHRRWKTQPGPLTRKAHAIHAVHSIQDASASQAAQSTRARRVGHDEGSS